jgi:hypothetical protein
MRVRNRGEGATVGETSLVASLPKGTKVVSVRGPGWHCETQANEAGCTRQTPIAAHAMLAAVKLTVKAPPHARRVKSRAALFTAGDSRTANNSSSTSATARPR